MKKLNKKEVFNSPACKKWAKKMEEMLEEQYEINIWDTLKFFYGLNHHKKMIAKPIRISDKNKGKKR